LASNASKVFPKKQLRTWRLAMTLGAPHAKCTVFLHKPLSDAVIILYFLCIREQVAGTALVSANRTQNGALTFRKIISFRPVFSASA
jgi:hypothetical protein